MIISILSGLLARFNLIAVVSSFIGKSLTVSVCVPNSTVFSPFFGVARDGCGSVGVGGDGDLSKLSYWLRLRVRLKNRFDGLSSFFGCNVNCFCNSGVGRGAGFSPS